MERIQIGRIEKLGNREEIGSSKFFNRFHVIVFGRKQEPVICDLSHLGKAERVPGIVIGSNFLEGTIDVKIGPLGDEEIITLQGEWVT